MPTNPAPTPANPSLVAFVSAMVLSGYLAVLGWLGIFGNLAWYLLLQQPPAPSYLFGGFSLSLVSVPIALILMVLLFNRRRQYWRAVVVPLCLLAVALLGYFDPTGALYAKREGTRVAGLSRVATTARPLVEAILRYQHDHNSPPASLDLLVPTYLPAIPPTGIWVSPEFRYYSPHHRKDAQSWHLGVSVPRGLIDFTEYSYVYPPTLAPPARPPRVIRHGNWAYVQD
jgi:hypothetical protein